MSRVTPISPTDEHESSAVVEVAVIVPAVGSAPDGASLGAAEHRADETRPHADEGEHAVSLTAKNDRGQTAEPGTDGQTVPGTDSIEAIGEHSIRSRTSVPSSAMPTPGRSQMAVPKVTQDEAKPALAEVAAQAFEPSTEAAAKLKFEEPVAAGEWLELEEDEPKLTSKEDFPRWRAWAEAAGHAYRAAAHPHRVDETTGLPTPLPICGSGPPELGAALGVGIRLYFDWLKLLAVLCALGLLVKTPSLGFALRAIWDPALGGYDPDTLIGPASALALTTIGQRIGCGTQFCRLLTVIEASLEIIFTPLLLAAAARFASRAQTAASLNTLLLVRVSSYTVELHGVPRDAPPAFLAEQGARTISRVRLECEAASLDQQLAPDTFAFNVHDVVPVSNNGTLLRSALGKAQLEKETLTLATRAHRQALAGHMYASKQTERRLQRKQRTLLAWRAKDSKRAKRSDGLAMQSAFVTFEQIEGAEAALQCWQRGWSLCGLFSWLQQSKGFPLSCLRRHAVDLRMPPPPPADEHDAKAARAFKRRRPLRLVATVAPEPSELVWENLSGRFQPLRQLRLVLTLLVVVIAMAASLAIIIFANGATQTSAASKGASSVESCEAFGGKGALAWDSAAESARACGKLGPAPDWDGDPAYQSRYESALARHDPLGAWSSDAGGGACAACYCASFISMQELSKDEAIARLGSVAAERSGPSAMLLGCREQLAKTAGRYGLQYGAIFVVILTNMMLKRLNAWLVLAQRHGSKGAEVAAKASILASSQFVNTALLAIAVASALHDGVLSTAGVASVGGAANAGGTGQASYLCWAPPSECAVGGARQDALLPCCAFGPGGVLLRASVLSLDRSWFVLLGGAMLFTLTIQLLVLTATPAYSYVHAWLSERLLLSGAVTAEAVRELLTGPEFDLAAQYGQALSFGAIVLIFGPAMPYLYFLGLVGFISLYWTDKIMLLRINSLPPAYDERLSLALAPRSRL